MGVGERGDLSLSCAAKLQLLRGTEEGEARAELKNPTAGDMSWLEGP